MFAKLVPLTVKAILLYTVSKMRLPGNASIFAAKAKTIDLGSSYL